MNSSFDPTNHQIALSSRLKNTPSNNNKKVFYKTKDQSPITDNLYDLKSLDKWDEEHVPIHCPTVAMRKTTCNLIQRSTVAHLTVKAQSSKLGAFKGLQSNEYVKSLCKQIKEEESSVVAQNIHILKKKFNFDMFRTQTNINTNHTLKTVSFNLPSKKLRNSKVDPHDELYQVGNELAIRKTIGQNGNFTNEIEKDEEIHIKNRTLQHHDIELEGKYRKVVDSDYYKKKLKERQKLELTYRNEIIEVAKEIDKQEAEIYKLFMKQKQLYDEIEEKKRNYYDNKDAMTIISRQRDEMRATRKPSTMRVDFYQSTKELEHFNHLSSQLEKLKKEYDDFQITNQWNLSQIKSALIEHKSNLKYLKTHKIKITNELIEYYYQLFKKGIDVRSLGLSWILICLYELGRDVTLNDFPNFLDYPSANYLIEYSKEAIMKKKMGILLNLFIGNFLCKNDQIGQEENFDANITLSSEESSIMKEYGDLISQIYKKSKSQFFLKNDAIQRNDNKQIRKALEKIRKQARSILSEDCSNKLALSTDYSTLNNSRVKLKSHLPSCDEMNINDVLITNKNCTTTKREVISICEVIRHLIKKTDTNMSQLKENHMFYFKSKYDIIRQKGISECVKYDLMYCALFGNYAVI